MRKIWMVALIMVMAWLAVTDAVAQEKHVLYTDQQLKSIWSGIKDQCATMAKAEGEPGLYDRCVTYQKGEWKIWHQLFVDPQVSQLAWDQCDFETGFRQTLNLHTYNDCLRLAKGRPDLQ